MKLNKQTDLINRPNAKQRSSDHQIIRGDSGALSRVKRKRFQARVERALPPLLENSRSAVSFDPTDWPWISKADF